MLYKDLQLTFILGNWQTVVVFFKKAIKKKEGFVCLPCSLNDLTYKEIEPYRSNYQSVDYCTADGMPLVIYFQHLKKIGKLDRIYGADLMKKILQETQQENHFFCGTTPETLKKLEKKIVEYCPDIKSLSTYSPPFAEVQIFQEKLLEKLKKQSTNILWIGLSSPKQIILASYIKKNLPNLKIFCVGAAFDFLSGQKKRAPKILQKLALEWLYRLIQEPVRLSERYLYRIPIFLLKKFGKLLKKLLFKNTEV
jgi:N-acetylglucosaminyldiphosphoundecaprenol N-acetyl-beta-D-mannosaminyltransferase